MNQKESVTELWLEVFPMNPANLLKTAHWSMAATFLLSVAIIYIAYGAELSLSIPVQVALHIFLIILPAFFKIGYVVRLNALKQLGRPVN